MVLPRDEREQLRAELLEATAAAVDARTATIEARTDALETEQRAARDRERAARRALREGRILGESVGVADAFAASLGISAGELRSALQWLVSQRRDARKA